MADKDRTRRLAPQDRPGRLERWWTAWAQGLTFRQLLIGVATALILAFLVLGYDFHRIPDYELGAIADRDISAPHDFTVMDAAATQQKREESLTSVPAVFDLDLAVNSRLESTLRSNFAEGRRASAERREELGLSDGQSLEEEDRNQLLEQLRQTLLRFAERDPLIEILFEHEFSPELENQMVSLLQSAMKYPGVIASRDLLLIYRDRSIILLNRVTGNDEVLNDFSLVRDLTQARALLRQNEFELTAVQGTQKLELIGFLEDRIEPSVRFNEDETQLREELAMEQVPPVLIQIRRGHKIIRAGDPVAAQSLMILQELKNQEQATQATDEFVGLLLLALFFVFALWRYLMIYHEKAEEVPGRFMLAALILVVHLGIAKVHALLAEFFSQSLTIQVLQDASDFYWVIPVSFGSILLVLLAGGQLAILYSLPASVFIGLMTGELAMGVFTVVSSLTAVYALRDYRERSAVGRAAVMVGLVNVLAALGLQLHAGSFQWTIFSVRTSLALLSGIISAMLASLLLPLLENLFKMTTDIRLLELSNLNSPILRRLALEAPGTYHHSLNVGVLAEAGAEAIGANPLLARVGAYYHDIGKLKKPEYYVENQIYMANKHEGLSPSMSSLILASHVKDGKLMAAEMGLAPDVAALIPQHHGTKLMAFFYQKAKQAARSTDAEVKEEEFRYPGPKPQSREAAIMMLADQVEAASRTLQDPHPGQIRSMIRRLIQGTIQDRQFDECDITTRDLDQITRAFERVITGMYHHRVDYPGCDFNKRVEHRQRKDQPVQ